jgi:micrococcal nuclease|tara:strand:+ start:559 stop:894 length:336 start_codon:yes stop_codon:yes gene_type:complete
MYEYRAFVRKVYDGDTITCDIDLGFEILFKNQKLRLYGINTPEVRGPTRPEGLKVRDLVRSRISNKWVTIKTRKDKKGKYGRWIAEIYEADIEESINEWLLREGHAVEFMK